MQKTKKKTRFGKTDKKRKKEQKKQEKTLTGTISFNFRGKGFISAPDFAKEFEVNPDDTFTALPGDEVEFVPLKNGKARVIKVLNRKTEKIVGIAREHGKHFILIPEDKRIPTDFLILNPPESLQDNTAVVAKISWDSTQEYPTATTEEILGRAGAHDTIMRAILYSHEFEDKFPPQVKKEAKTIQEKFHANFFSKDKRKDLTDTLTVTIDPKNAQDFDDAISLQKTETGYKLGVHIADVTFFVKPHSALDKEARKRATSVYLVDRTIPMLPEELSNDVCSLVPNEERFAFSVLFNLTPEGEVVDFEITESVIKSDKRLTYTQAQEIINSSNTDELSVMLKEALKLAEKLKEKRNKKGALQFSSREVEIELDKKGKPVSIKKKEVLPTMEMIEEFMLLANRVVAEWSSSAFPSDLLIYRIHETPDEQKIIELKQFVRALGYDALDNVKSRITNKDLARLLLQVKNTPHQELIEQTLLRSLAKAVYSHKNVGHFSLGFPFYTHFTSPIRRYPDIMVHRIIKSRLQNKKIAKDELASYIKLAQHSTKREIEAMRAERDSIAQKQTEYMAEHIGEVFEGTITGVTERGIFVAEQQTMAEGFIPIKDLPGFYSFNDKKLKLENKKGEGFSLGDKIKIRCKQVDVVSRKITWQYAQ